MKQRLGTNAFTGLNVGTAPHLIGASELTESENGWTDQEGCWMTARSPKALYTGYSNITSFAAGYANGSEYKVWTDLGDNYLYVNGAQFVWLSMGSTARMKSINDGFLLFGESGSASDKNYIFDGTVTREVGTWQATDSDYAPRGSIAAATGYAISAVTQANPGVVTCAAHGLAVGSVVKFWITGVTDMIELNDTLWEATVLSGTTFSINADTTGFTAYSSGGGTAYKNACGISGDYKFYLVPTIELSDGTVLEGNPVGFVDRRIVAPSSSADVFTLTETDSWSSVFGAEWSSSGIAHYYSTGTLGTEYNAGLRLYRTKANGADFYLEDSWEYGVDATLSTSFMFANSALTYYSGTVDLDLGAVYLYGLTDHTRPARAIYACTAGSRMFFVPSRNRNQIHWSRLEGIEFSSPLDYITVPDRITAIHGYRDSVVIWSNDRMWVLSMSGGVPDLQEIITPVGTTYDKAIASTDMGVVFLRQDGLWLFNGAKVECISRRAFASITGPSSVVCEADTIYMSGTTESYIVRIRDGGWHWHKGQTAYPYSSSTAGTIYAASDEIVVELFAGDYIGGKMTTKAWGIDSEEWVGENCLVDVEGDSSFSILLNGGQTSDTRWHSENLAIPTTGRRLANIPIPRLRNPYFTISVETSGDLKVYGVYPEVTK